MTGEDLVEKIIFPLFSTFTGAFLAFRYQYKIEKRRDKRQVLQHLVAYRNVGADELDWIKMMNIVNVVFHDDEIVRQEYAKYLDLIEPDKIKSGEYIDVYYDMLYEMAKASGYSQLIRSDLTQYYAPIGLRQHYPLRGRMARRRIPKFSYLSSPLLRKRRIKG